MSNLRRKASTGILWELMGSYGGQIIAFVISIFLARLLSPEEFGIVGMSMVFLAILEVFKNFGFSSALIQRKNVSDLMYSSVFYANIGIGLFLTLIIFIAAPFIADFYNNSAVKPVMQLLAISFFLSSFNIVQTAILNKEFNFKFLTTRQLIANLSAGVLAIVFAFAGYGVYALVIQRIAAAVISTFLLWKVSNWRPSLTFSFAEIKQLMNFSGFVFLSQLFAKIVSELETLLFGKLFSASFLGYFSRANSLNRLIYTHSVSSLSKVLFPALSVVQDDEKRFKEIYLKLINLVSVISLGLTGVFYLSGDTIILLLFGEQWEPSVELFKIVILKGFTLPISMIVVNSLLAKGYSKEVFIVGRIREIFYIAAMPIAYYFDVYIYLYASVGVSLLALLINNFFASRYLKIGFYRQLIQIFPNLLIVGVAISLITLILSNFNIHFVYRSLIGAFAFLLIYILWLFLSKSVALKESKMLFELIVKRVKS